MPKISIDEYKSYAARISPQSPTTINSVKAFLGGGLICVIGQAVLELWLLKLHDPESAAAATSVTMIFLGVLLTALGMYDVIAKFCKAGTLVPITGFANSVTSPAMEFKSEGLIAGMSAKMFVIAGPVIVYGVTASIIYVIIYFVFI